MNTKTTCLFGGALIGAGLCSNANAADVNWSFGNGNARDLINDDFSTQGGPFSSWDANTGTGAHSIGGDFGFDMAADASSTPTTYAYAYTFGYFTVDADTTLTLDWDLGNGSINFSSLNHGDILLASNGESGTLDFTFIANRSYYFFGTMTDHGGSASSVTMGQTINVVPLPPSALAGLGMLAGLGAYRRSRK